MSLGFALLRGRLVVHYGPAHRAVIGFNRVSIIRVILPVVLQTKLEYQDFDDDGKLLIMISSRNSGGGSSHPSTILPGGPFAIAPQTRVIDLRCNSLFASLPLHRSQAPS